MNKETSYYQQALELPEFQTYLLVSLLTGNTVSIPEDALEAIALNYMETLPEEGVRGRNWLHCKAKDALETIGLHYMETFHGIVPTPNYCEGCGSTNTYIHGSGYNSVQCCRDCNHESHSPSKDSIKILLDKLTIIK